MKKAVFLDDMLQKDHIKPRKPQAKASLKKLREYSPVVDRTRDIFLLLTPDGQILDANLAALKAYGYTKEELLSLNLRDLRAPESHPDLSLQLAEACHSSMLFESLHIRKDGSTFPVEVSSEGAQCGKAKVVLNIIRNITERKEAQAALSASEKRHWEMLEHMVSAIAVYEVVGNGEDFIVKEVNRAVEIMDGIPRESILGQSVAKYFPNTEQANLLLEAFRRVWLTGKPEHYPVTFYQGNRITGWRENYIYKLSSGELVAAFEDITARKLAEEAVWQEKERAQVTLHSIGDGVITTDLFGNIESLNPVAEELTGWSDEEAKGLPLLQVFNIDMETGQSLPENPVEKCLQAGSIIKLDDQAVLIHRNGYRFAIEDSAAPIRNKQGEITGAVLVFHNVSDKRSLIQQLSYLAHHDNLTGLPNRLLFNDRLTHALAHAQRNKLQLAVLFLDIDRFKLINDTMGHAMGDLLLQYVADRLKRCLRQEDTIARQGGDEFLVILPDIRNPEDIVVVCRKILEALSASFNINGYEVFITASIGVALYPSDGENVETLVKHADSAMYHAKDKGRNNYQFFTSTLNVTANDRLAMENNLRRALERNEFHVFYQPQVDLATGKIVGVEALARWHSPDIGFVSPTQFIPIAEETGLILSIGEWVLHTACSQVATWQKNGLGLVNLAVNLSPRQFRQPDLVFKIAQALAETGLSPKSLELEITETIAMENAEFTITALNELKKMGIRISIDDFGTGFSSLSYLGRLPLDTLKIDQSFTQDIGVNQNGAEVASAIISLAQNLRLRVIAEGVETREQLEFLRSRRCDEMQGYLFSRPVAATEFEQLLLTNKKLETAD